MTHSFPPRRPSDRGPQTLKGIAPPAAAWRVLRRRDRDRRAEALQGDDLVPFVNRTGEITLLLDRWRMAGSGHGQNVLLSGEAGIAKSRLLRAFVVRPAGQDFLCDRFQARRRALHGRCWSVGFVSGGRRPIIKKNS